MRTGLVGPRNDFLPSPPPSGLGKGQNPLKSQIVKILLDNVQKLDYIESGMESVNILNMGDNYV